MHTNHYPSQESDGSWSVYAEDYAKPEDHEPIDYSQRLVESGLADLDTAQRRAIELQQAARGAEASVLTLPDGKTYPGRLQLDADGQAIIAMATCGNCGFSWNDALMTSLTPTPSGRCPNEYGHEDEDEDEDIMTIYVTRSSGSDGAILILIDTAEGAGPIRVAVNDGNVFAQADYEHSEPPREARQKSMTVTAADIAYTGVVRS